MTDKLREAAEFAAHALEGARVWNGGGWHYNPLHPLIYLPALEKLRAALAEPLTECADNDSPWLVYKYTRAARAEPQAESRNDCGEKSDPDVADIIAGALQTSRGHAYELMREACTGAQTEPQPVEVPEMTDGRVLQGGLNNAELLSAWIHKLPSVAPSQRDLSAFAVGAEVGFQHARNLERQDWSRVHHVLAKHGVHPGRTDDHLADVIDRALTRSD